MNRQDFLKGLAALAAAPGLLMRRGLPELPRILAFRMEPTFITYDRPGGVPAIQENIVNPLFSWEVEGADRICLVRYLPMKDGIGEEVETLELPNDPKGEIVWPWPLLPAVSESGVLTREPGQVIRYRSDHVMLESPGYALKAQNAAGVIVKMIDCTERRASTHTISYDWNPSITEGTWHASSTLPVNGPVDYTDSDHTIRIWGGRD